MSSKVVLWEIILGENGGDRTKICATYQKIENLLTINVQKQLDLSR